mgnify:CR=1 FL=1
MYPAELKYSKTHEWVRLDGRRGVMGVTDYAANELGDVTYVELPEPGVSIVKGDPFGVIESIKAVEDLLSPLSGHIVESNTSLVSSPETINRDPYGEGWLIALEIEDSSELQELLSAEQYEAFVEEGGQ